MFLNGFDNHLKLAIFVAFGTNLTIAVIVDLDVSTATAAPRNLLKRTIKFCTGLSSSDPLTLLQEPSIHYKPKSRRREQIDAKDHWTSVTPDYLTKEFSKARDAAQAYDHVPAGERPTFHEIRALGAWLYEQQEFPQAYIQAFMGHADEKMTRHYQDGHDTKQIEYVEVGAELAF